MNKLINYEYIKTLNPCKDRLNNYTTHYATFSGDLTAFFELDHITHRDKLWVALRSMGKKQIVECACRFAEATLSIYENKYPGDFRPRKAIEAARSGIGILEARRAAIAAYAAASYAAAAYAAIAAIAIAAADVDAAAAPAADAAASYASYAAAADAAADVDAARINQETVQLKIILDVIAGN